MREKRSRRRRAGTKEETQNQVLGSAAQDFTVDESFSPKAGTSKLQSHGAPADASPDSKCPICLDKFDNVSHLDRCLHRFCFRCIQEWAKNKAECPLCKQPFYSIFHSVRAEDDFKEYVLRPTMNGSLASPEGHRFRYRSTVTRDYRIPNRRLRSSSSHRTESPPDNGILFEGLPNQAQQRGSDIQQMIRRLASRRQASAEGRSMRQIQEQELVNFRRALYRSGVRVRSIQDGGRYRDISAEFFRRNPAVLHRLIPWLKRELTVLFGTHGSLVNIVQHIIMSNVTRYDMETQAFVDDLRPFLLHRTDHFHHEFINFARCPYNIDAYDQHANYDCPAPSYGEGSHSESSVITISPDEVVSRDLDVPSSSIDVGQAPWDDETPGPSYSTSEPATTSVSATLNVSESSDEEPSNSQDIAQEDIISDVGNMQDMALPTDDCVIVGYVKPLAERTPELVELSSDSEGSLCEVKTEDTKKSPVKPFILSDSNESSRSSSPSSFLSSDKHAHKSRNKEKTDSGKIAHSKKKEKGKKSIDGSSKTTRESRKGKRDVNSSHAVSRWRARSRSSDCYSRSSRNKGYDNRKRPGSKSRIKARGQERSRHKSWRELRRSRSRDRSLSWRSRTVSLTSESSRERNRSRSRSQNRNKGRSRSNDSDYSFGADNYSSTYQWEYTYYSRNRDRDCYEQSYRKRTRGRGHYSRPSGSPEYKMQSYPTRKDTRKERGHVTRRHHDRYRSRSRSSSQINMSETELTHSDKPSGKRKYKTRHLETHEEDASNIETQARKTKVDNILADKGSSVKCTEDYKNVLGNSSCNEPKQKWKKKARSPSVEIVFEGKAGESLRHHKKKKKKHKKKRHREQSGSSLLASPIIITIDSESDTPMSENVPCNSEHTLLPVKNLSIDSTVPSTSHSPATSAATSTTDLPSGEIADLDPKCDDVSTSNGHVDAATGILDGLHFEDSSDEQACAAECSPPSFQSPEDDIVAPPEVYSPNSEATQPNAFSEIPSDIMELEENLSKENSEDESLESMT
ncbi:E3 ubiquitin-protein ligase Topors [Bombina bombina]|uniref:E3 ubiquitin-protein ligase Topors n=1 Tax=Bombina bombina TaxID=8345 RepID=UPI00235B306F|nr:E3 ubiquitin-protein ligase Topors [Bombina bombina]